MEKVRKNEYNKRRKIRNLISDAHEVLNAPKTKVWGAEYRLAQYVLSILEKPKDTNGKS